MNLPAPTNDAFSLRSYGDRLESYVRGLESLGQTSEMYGSLLVPVVLDKLPIDVRKSIAREHGRDNLMLQNLRKSITKEIEILEAGQGVMEPDKLHTTAFFTGTQPRSHNKGKLTDTRKKVNTHTCIFCSGQHYPTECSEVTDANARNQIVKQKQLCFNCLGSHRVAACKSTKRCKNCNGMHHTSICKGKEVITDTKQEPKIQQTAINVVETSDTTSVLHASQVSPDILLKTATAPVIYNDVKTECNILFDEGAQRSFITQKLADKLEIKTTGKVSIQLSAFGDLSQKVRNLETATIQLQTDTGENVRINTLIVPEIAVPIHNSISHTTKSLPHLRGLKLANSVHSGERFEIDLLIGADYYWEIIEDKIIRGKGPTAVQSKIGYLLSGPTIGNISQHSRSTVLLNVISSHQLEETEIEKFWTLESIGINTCENKENNNYLQTYQNTAIDYENGKYTAKLPWKVDHPDLPSNMAIAKGRTDNIIRRLNREPDLLQKYSEIINEQEKRGFIERVPDMEDDNNNHMIHYIPHHPVKKDSETTPIRIVYDCSCKPQQDLASLNDCLMSTPPNLNDLTKILMRFRIGKYGISTDIEKAFLQIGLDKKDRDATRFFWLADPDDPRSNLTTYRFKSILFGATCSPFILNATLLKHLDENENSITQTMKRDLYVDNILSSVETYDEAIAYFKDARNVMSKGGFNLRSWSSNCSDLTEIAKNENLAEKNITVKILGMIWNTEKDTISFHKVNVTDIKEPNITKREILSQSSRIYDPMGLLSPVSVRAKILMQDLWKDKLEWDEPLPLNVQQQWMELARDLEFSTNTELPRQILTKSTDEPKQLHVFVDASQKAYGSAVYITNGQQSTLVFAKSRVAPIKTLTLPQLELMAAVIGARIATHVKSALSINKVTYWSDSQIVLHWLTTTKHLKKFLHNRITEIKSLTQDSEWKYCPTNDNPADLLTRGISASQLADAKLWFNGPEWINCSKSWPQWTPNTCILLTNIDQEENVTNTIEGNNTHGIHCILDIMRYSTLTKILRVSSWIYRFIANCRKSRSQRIQSKFITCEELQAATEKWIISAQRISFDKEIRTLKSQSNTPNTLIRQLRLYIDEKEIIRCRGRIHNAPISENSRFPCLLPNNYHFTELLISEVHKNLKHSGVLATVTEIRQNYWIPKIRQQVKKVLRKCVTCRKVTGKPYSAPDPPPLPKTRLMEAPPFTVTGVDFTGALYVKDNNGQGSKVFICLFTCASTRAVHLEVVTDLKERSFLQAFRRFTSRKSLPRVMISDNASTYMAASETLERLTKSETLNDALSVCGTTWKFIIKRAPWYGGWWERLIGLTKMCLRKVLGRSYITLEDLQTIVTEIEAVLNDRPLTYVSTDIEDQEPLTPSHLLYGRRITTTPYPRQDIDENTSFIERSDISKRAELQNFVIDQFWSRWKSEYLTSLREYHTRTGDNDQTIKVGDVVQIHEDKYPRNKWTIGVVDSLITGNDGLTRAAEVRTKSGRFSRPIVKLYPLEICDNIHPKETRETQQPGTSNIQRRLPFREAAVCARRNIHEWTKK
ncbi:uncharacterized protein LOC134716648 [Mytilus trossulus]|uniref:uncharacterized protein LOC134716648 n=1 Tax=Mytilus trossulus TaxID=6551 RepID=UPI003006D589